MVDADVQQSFLERITRSPSETQALAESLGGLLCGGEVLALVGDLGTGKTTWTKGLVRGLNCPDPDAVCSPTYVLEHVYPGRVPVRHFDVYRLSGGEELASLGFDEHLGSEAVLVLEWADRVADWLPEETLTIQIEHLDGDQRRISFSGPASWARRLEKLDA